MGDYRLAYPTNSPLTSESIHTAPPFAKFAVLKILHRKHDLLKVS